MEDASIEEGIGMSGWIDDLAAAFAVEPLTEPETVSLLEIAREVAHRVERKGTPLAAFLLGIDVASRTAAGAARDRALEAAIGTIEQLLPPAPPATP
jgi:Domain of unknown function (DUF6457)